MLFKENKLLISWGVFAIVISLFAFNPSTSFHGTKESNSEVRIPVLTFTNEQRKALEEFFLKLNQKQGFNGTVLVGQKDSVFYHANFGWADYKRKDSITNVSTFQLASVSKQFTAVAILQLYQRGYLQLSDTLQKYFPDFPHKGITIHHLLVHRSGLPNYHYFLQQIPVEHDTAVSCQKVVDVMIEKQYPLYSNVNRRFQYSNTGYALLAAIVEKVSGLPFETYLEKEIFNPLQMTGSFVYRGKDDQKDTNATTGYLYRWREAPDNILDQVLGDKGIYCSALDLFKWDQGLYKNKIIDFDTLQLAFQPMGKPLHSKSNYGYGWRMFTWPVDSTKILYHAGWWHGYRSLLLRIESDSTTIVVLKNRSQGARVTSQQLLNILYPPKIILTADSLQIVSDED